jgi:hypothetical protein
MGILDLLTKKGSIFTSTDGTTPSGFDTTTSKLNPQTLRGSQLDLEGKTPDKYTDNLPR